MQHSRSFRSELHERMTLTTQWYSVLIHASPCPKCFTELLYPVGLSGHESLHRYCRPHRLLLHDSLRLPGDSFRAKRAKWPIPQEGNTSYGGLVTVSEARTHIIWPISVSAND